MSRHIIDTAGLRGTRRGTHVIVLLGLAGLVFASGSHASPQVFAPWLDSPSDGATVTTTTPTFRWDLSIGADYYHLQVLSRFGSLIYDSDPIVGVFTTTFTLPAGYISRGNTYRWRMRAYDDGAPSLFWSGEWTFEVAATTPSTLAAPIQWSPLDGTPYSRQSLHSSGSRPRERRRI